MAVGVGKGACGTPPVGVGGSRLGCCDPCGDRVELRLGLEVEDEQRLRMRLRRGPISPGREFKVRTPMGRFGKTEELVGAAVYLASDAASFVSGEILVVDGGFLASGVNQ